MSDQLQSWVTTSLEAIAGRIDYGHTASAVEASVGPKFLRITDIQNGHVDWDSVPYCRASAEEVDQYRLRRGDIVFARTGATTGKSFIIDDCPENTVFASYLIRVRPGPSIEPRFLARFFDTPNYWRQIKKHVKGAGQPGVNATSLKSLGIPLPPLPEQKRIADILDKADDIRRKRRDVTKGLSDLIGSQFLTVFGDPLRNPKKWEPGTFDDHLTLVQYGPRFFNESYSTDGIRIVRITDLDQQGNLDYSAMPRMTVSDKDRESYVLRPGDLLLARSGATVGKTALIDDAAPECIAGAYFIRLRFTDKIRPLYAQLVLRSRPVQTIIAEKSHQSAQQNFNGPAIRALPLPAPPTAIQDKFVEFHQKVVQSGRRFTETDCKVDELFNSLVQRAFRGEL